MEEDTFESLWNALSEIDIKDEPRSDKNDVYAAYEPRYYNFIPKQKYLRTAPQYVDFETYIQEKCENKIKILNRETFYQIKRPIIIFFNHFRVKCAYLTKWLDKLYQLALKYGDRIEFIAADLIEMDVIYSETNPVNFFCRTVRPEDESTYIYAIDEKKGIYSHYDPYKTVETLSELSENLLNGKLFPSQPLPTNNENNLVKICVYDNYDELVLKSSKNILLIINLNKYEIREYEPNYDNLAVALKDCNLDIAYMEAEKNYVPFEYFAYCFPTIIFIPANDKQKFIRYENSRTEECIMDFVKNCIEKPEYLSSMQQEQLERHSSKIAKVPHDFELDFKDLEQFLGKYYENSIKVLNRDLVEKSKLFILIVFMDFGDKCLYHHIEWLNKIYQAIERSYSVLKFVADFKDIDIINTKWKLEDIIISAQGHPKIYALDRLKHTYEFGNFDSISSLFYFTDSLVNGDFYHSQLYPRNMKNELVKIWNADYFHIFLNNLKKHIFITFYLSDDENTETLSLLLAQVANDVSQLNVEVVKFDIKFNYLSLEYVHSRYPVHYFIPKNNKRNSLLYVDVNLNKDKMLEFIKNNI